MQNKIQQIVEEHQGKILPIIGEYIENRSLLDVGCGNGLNALYFNDNLNTKITLLDIEDIRDKEVVSFPFYMSSIEKLPFRQNEFDIVFVEFVFHHLPPSINIEQAFKEIGRVGKTLIIVEEIRSGRTHIQKAIEYDTKMNKLFHPTAQYTKVYRYFSDAELKDLFARTELRLIKEQIFDEGCEEDGFLQRKVYVLK